MKNAILISWSYILMVSTYFVHINLRKNVCAWMRHVPNKNAHKITFITHIWYLYLYSCENSVMEINTIPHLLIDSVAGYVKPVPSVRVKPVVSITWIFFSYKSLVHLFNLTIYNIHICMRKHMQRLRINIIYKICKFISL